MSQHGALGHGLWAAGRVNFALTCELVLLDAPGGGTASGLQGFAHITESDFRALAEGGAPAAERVPGDGSPHGGVVGVGAYSIGF